MPARLPALEMSWQGKPAVRMSTGSTWVQSTVRMSPRLGMPGQWWARTVRACRSGFGIPGDLAAEHQLDGQVEAAVAGPQRSDPQCGGVGKAHATS